MQHVEEILALWSKLTGFDPEAKRFTMGDLDVRLMSEGIKRAQELDPTDALALMLTEAYLDAFLQDRSFRASEMLADLDKHFTFLEDAQEMRRLLNASGMPEAREALKGWVLEALAHYGAAHRKDIKEVLESRDRIAFLWRDALDAVDRTLETHQFMQGEPDATTPRYHDHVLSTWTVNGLLQAMVGMPSGIVLSMVRDADAIHSFFVFGIRNGGTLTLLTDRTEWAHPFAKRMARRPDRALDSRMQRSWFPYSVLDVKVTLDDHGDVESFHVAREEGLVPREQVARKVRRINALEPSETVWLAMMYNLITQRFFHANHRTKVLSYLGEQVTVASGMEVDAFARNLPVTDYEPLRVEPLRSVDLTSASVVADAMLRNYPRGERRGSNVWMEERYRHLVDDARINLIGPPGTKPLLLSSDGKVAEKPKDGFGISFRSDMRWELESFDASLFHDREHLLADRVFTARYNQAAEIDRLARREFELRRAEVEDWWLAALVANKPALLAAAGKGELLGRPAFTRAKDFYDDGDKDQSTEGLRGNILRIRHRDDFERYEYPSMHSGVTLSDDEYARSNWIGRTKRGELSPSDHCPVTGTKPAWRARFTPRDAGDLALLAGVPVEALPDVLLHWTDTHESAGNHLLDRIDPLEWVTKNPWRELDFNVVAWLSQSGLKKLAKVQGAPDIARFRKPKVN